MDFETQLAHYLDEALALCKKGKSVTEAVALFPAEFRADLSGLLDVAEALSDSYSAQSHKQGFTKLVATLSKNTIHTLPEERGSFFANLGKRFTPKLLVALGGSTLALFLVVHGVFTFVSNKLLQATSSATEQSPLALSADRSLSGVQTNAAFENGLSKEDVGVEYAAATGLGQTDERVTVGRVGSLIGGATNNSLVQGAAAGLRKAVDTIVNKEGVIADYNEAIYYPDQPYSSVKDQREFMKTDYNATVYSRKPSETGTRIKTIIRGYGGRIDNISLSAESGFISFVVPAETFEEFKNELTSLVPSRLFEESTTMQNLLPQKQAIEQQAQTTQNSITSTQQKINDITKAHTTTIASLNRQIASTIQELNDHVLVDGMTYEEAQIVQKKQEILTRQLNSLRRSLAQENASFANNSNALRSNLQSYQSQAAALQNQDQNILDTVATVRGTVQLRFISLPALIDAYLPYYWLWGTSAVVLAWYVWYRGKKNEIKI